MSTKHADGKESIDTRTDRALTESMTVVDDDPRVRDDPERYVVDVDGGDYVVSLEEGRESCECPDHVHRSVRCKHIRRTEIATGRRDVPDWADSSAVDEYLGAFVTPATSDTRERIAEELEDDEGGEDDVIVADDEGEVLEDGPEDDDRPDDCECHLLSGDYPCAHCYIEEGAEWPDDEGGELLEDVRENEGE